MGSKQSKIEGIYLSEAQLAVEKDEPKQLQSTCTKRPIYLTMGELAAMTQQKKQTPAEQTKPNSFGTLRKRLLKGFVYNINDPRSPGAQLNRTPLFFDETIDKTLDLNDTFADLFVESRSSADEETEHVPAAASNAHDAEMQIDDENANDAPLLVSTPVEKKYPIEEQANTDANNSETNQNASFTCEEVSLDCEETMPCPDNVLVPTPTQAVQPQQQFDPRSPTFGVDRTPIIFSDDDEAGEDAMLESILATLSLDISNASSISLSYPGTPTSHTLEVRKELRLPHTEEVGVIKLSNKHLERVRVGKKRVPRRKLHAQPPRQRIYEDGEDAAANGTAVSTPKQKSALACATNGSSTPESTKRTPLSCVKNRAHLRSRSVESTGKSLKTRLSLTSYDDSLNPSENAHVADLRIMQDTLEAS